MAIGYTRSTGVNSIPVWQGTDKDIQLAQGGFALVNPALASTDTIIPAGTPMVFDESTRTAVIVGGAFAQATVGGTATAYPVLKGHTLKVGDFLASGAVGTKAYAITSIDTTNVLFDTITVGTSIGAVTAGDYLFVSSATGATASAYPAVNGLLYAETQAQAGEDVSAVIRGTVYARRVPYSAALAALAGLKNIIYSQSQ
jgi:hypothetical protein